VRFAFPTKAAEVFLNFELLERKTGHTSGIDIAAGAVLGLGLTQDIAWKTNATKILAKRLGFVS
jgi:hypothetical protein